jgi:hypothetical protein
MAKVGYGFTMAASDSQLTQWAEACLRSNHLNTLVRRAIEEKSSDRAMELSDRAQQAAWKLLNEMIAAGASNPDEHSETSPSGLRG